MSTPVLSFRPGSGDVHVHVPTFLETRGLIHGSSGAGKTTLLFSMLQQTYGVVQQLVIDKEGQFSRLRKKYDYLLVGPDGEASLDLRKGMVEQLLMEVLKLQVNTIWDISDLKPVDQKQYVARLAQAAAHISSKSPLCDHMRLVVVDEADFFARQGGKKDNEPALDPLIDLASMGRKRGFCLVCATTRVERLDKNVSDMLENKLVGRSGASSSKRAAEELDFDKHGRRELLNLETGQFYGYGPAIAIDPVLITSADTEIKPRKRGEMQPPQPTPSGLKKVVAALATFKQEAEETAATVEDLQKQLTATKAELRRVQRGTTAAAPDPAVVQKQIDTAVARVRREREVDENRRITERLRTERELRGLIAELEKRIHQMGAAAAKIAGVAGLPVPEIASVSSRNVAETAGIVSPKSLIVPPKGTSGPSKASTAPRAPAPRPAATGDISGPHLKILGALATLESLGISEPNRAVVGAIAGYAAGGGSFKTYLSKLSSSGYVEYPGDGAVTLTESGRAAAPAPDESIDDLSDLHAAWFRLLKGPHQKIIGELIAEYPNPISRAELGERTGYESNGGSFKTYLSKVSSLGLCKYPSNGMVVASELLFPEGLR